MCKVSCVTCHLSHFTWHMSHIKRAYPVLFFAIIGAHFNKRIGSSTFWHDIRQDKFVLLHEDLIFDAQHRTGMKQPCLTAVAQSIKLCYCGIRFLEIIKLTFLDLETGGLQYTDNGSFQITIFFQVYFCQIVWRELATEQGANVSTRWSILLLLLSKLSEYTCAPLILCICFLINFECETICSMIILILIF